MTATALPNIPLLRAGGVLREIPVTAIRAARRNPRTDAESTIESLAASLGAGMVQYPIVVAVSDDEYELVDGERRWRAAQAAGQETLLCLVRDPGTPSATLFTQILANLHRQELGPLDESAALKAAWLMLNAQAMGLSEQADAILGAATQLRDALAPLRALLDDAGWNWREPPVSQAVFVERLGLGISASVLKKKLQVLSANDSIQESARQHKLTAAAIRALMNLDPDQQATLLAAIDADPPLAKAVRSIVQGVKQKGRTIEEAISVVSGRDADGDDSDNLAGASPSGGSQVAAPSYAVSSDDDDGEATSDGEPSRPAAPARPTISDDAAMDAVLPIIEIAQELQTKLTQLRRLVGTDATLTDLPQPWGEYASEAVRLITTTIQPYSS
ncbi:ParB/RepB/Spo0J family partition protein [Chloroflexus sp.]|uniref:ParB/RepB/Spo0J family partition protein n=1 Tax=Chloroflexus sp. TaxID=1904827 RepID=UPI002ACE3272|nr:ParB N-terminal domain-containing protein [Chloroflexus sp.]